MIFKESGNKQLPTVILLHGGGLSSWSWKRVAGLLEPEYHIVTPVIDGHGEDGGETFISIEDSAQKLIRYVDDHHNGTVFALSGLSVGAQIITEALSRRPGLARYAVLESALVVPIKGTAALISPAYGLFYGLIKKRWFAKLQAKTLCVPDELFEQYYPDSLKMSRQTLVNLTRSNGGYTLKDTLADTTGKVLIIVGGKEIGVMKKSAGALHETLRGSELYIAPSLKHGELSLVYPEDYVNVLKTFFASRRTVT